MSVPDLDLQRLTEQMKGMGAADLRLPPPVMEMMRAEVRDYRPGGDGGVGSTLVIRFPVQEAFQNPMGVMQGGMIAAAVDNAIGPLSYLAAPPSVTSQLTMTYLAPVTPDLPHLDVEARLVARAGRQLVFDATVRAPDGRELAIGRASQTIVRGKRELG
jgi:acyl-coenzyme A thioesterase PaaI-like protein